MGITIALMLRAITFLRPNIMGHVRLPILRNGADVLAASRGRVCYNAVMLW